MLCGIYDSYEFECNDIKWRDNNDKNDLLDKNYMAKYVLSCMQREGYTSVRIYWMPTTTPTKHTMQIIIIMIQKDIVVVNPTT